MILISIALLSLISSVLLVTLTHMVGVWYEFYFYILFFMAFYLAYFLVFLVWVIIYTSLYNPKNGPKPTKFTHRLLKRACETLLQMGLIRIHVRGIDKIPQEKKCLFVQNHISNYDPIASIWALRYFDFSFIYKNNLDKAPFVGKMLLKDNHISLNRNNNREGLEAIVKAIRLIEKGERNIFVYPEGTRSKTGEIASFHSGTFKIAEKTKCPIVVLSIENGDAFKYRFPRPTHIYIDVVKVLEYDDYKDMNTNELSIYVHNLIEDSLKELEEIKYKKHKKSL